jgi:hypothetical protein
MANLRIGYDDANRLGGSSSVLNVTGVTTGSVVSGTSILNTRNNLKSSVFAWQGAPACVYRRAFGTGVLRTVRMVAFPLSSFTPTATIKVRGFANIGDSSALFDTGNLIPLITTFGNTPTQSLSLGGGNYAVVYFIGGDCREVEITMTDQARFDTGTTRVISLPFIYIGDYWSPQYNCEYGAELGIVDLSKTERSEAGDLYTDVGPRHRTMALDFTLMPKENRDVFWRILLQNSVVNPLYISLTPDNDLDDDSGEAMYQIYGKMSKQSSMKYQFINQFNSRIDIEEL